MEWDTLPPIVRGLTGHNQRGANCWNATLLYHGVADKIEYTSDAEMEDFLHDKTINVSSEPAKIGDVIVLWDDNGELVHTAVYLGDWKVWHKVGMYNERGYEITSVDSALLIYRHDYSTISWHRVMPPSFMEAA